MAAETSMHWARARDGDEDSLAWLVLRLQPLLLAHATFRMGTGARFAAEPEDFVAEAWAVALPRLHEIEGDAARQTPLLVSFLARTILHLINNQTRRDLRRATAREADLGSGASAAPRLSWYVRAQDSIDLVADREEAARVAAAIGELDHEDREVLCLRGLEGQSNGTVATLLGVTPNAASLRYRRALDRLRARLPGSIIDELHRE